MQPTPDNPAPTNSHRGVVPTTLDDEISPLIQHSQNAFRRDLPQLLKEHYRHWVAYHSDQRIGLSSSKRQLYQECLGRGLQPGSFVVRSIEPEVPREVEDLPEV